MENILMGAGLAILALALFYEVKQWVDRRRARSREDAADRWKSAVDMLSTKNRVLDDIPWHEDNESSWGRMRFYPDLPDATWRKLNEGLKARDGNHG